jgi:hypothetical protein
MYVEMYVGEVFFANNQQTLQFSREMHPAHELSGTHFIIPMNLSSLDSRGKMLPSCEVNPSKLYG